MNKLNRHPVIACFDLLVGIRDSIGLYANKNPNDLGGSFASFCANNFMNSKAQLFQDLLVIFCLKGKRDGFFVEFGATNGRDLSNTFMLERYFGWKGLLAEPAIWMTWPIGFSSLIGCSFLILEEAVNPESAKDSVRYRDARC
jgi:hypothetical protein